LNIRGIPREKFPWPEETSNPKGQHLHEALQGHYHANAAPSAYTWGRYTFPLEHHPSGALNQFFIFINPVDSRNLLAFPDH